MYIAGVATSIESDTTVVRDSDKCNQALRDMVGAVDVRVELRNGYVGDGVGVVEEDGDVIRPHVTIDTPTSGAAAVGLTSRWHRLPLPLA